MTRLLTSDLLPSHRTFVLWLDDVGDWMDQGFDPRLLERWLAGGRSRLVLGWMSAADRQRYAEQGTSEALALERAADFLELSARPAGPSAAVERYRREVRRGDAPASAIHLVAIHQALGASQPDADAIDQALTMITGVVHGSDLLDELCSGTDAVLKRDDDQFSMPRDVADLVDEQVLSKRLADEFVQALLQTARPADLILIALGIARRGHFDVADAALRSARERGSQEIQPAVTRASMHIIEIRDGSSGATLNNPGGFAYYEPPGPRQRKAAAKPKDDDFDATFPKGEGLAERLYRQTVRRAVARVGVLVLIDCVAVAAGSAVAIHLRMNALKQHGSILGHDYLSLVLPTLAIAVGFGAFIGLYRAQAQRLRLALVLAQMAFATIVVMAGFVLIHVDAGTVEALFALFGSAVLIGTVFRFVYDLVSRWWVRSQHLAPRALVLGHPSEARRLARNIRHGSRPVQPVAFMSPAESTDLFCVGHYGRFESADDLARLRAQASKLHVAEIVVADRDLELAAKAAVTAEAQRMGLDVRFAVSEREVILGAVGAVQEHGLVYVPAALITAQALELKRLIDSAIVYLTLPIWGLIMLGYACYSWIRRRGQPIFVFAPRVSIGQTGFSMFQLRTRHVHDDETRGLYPTGRVEGLFERTGLDEIAQVFNVLRHEMAVVGPRPLKDGEVNELSQDQRRTLGARPGMTGPWQVAWPRGATVAESRTLDAEYLRRWRVAHDLELILRTPAIILRGWKATRTARLEDQRREDLARDDVGIEDLGAGDLPGDDGRLGS